MISKFAIRPGTEEEALAFLAARGFPATIERSADGQIRLVFSEDQNGELPYALPLHLGTKFGVVG